MREPALNPKQLLLLPVHDNKLFTPTAVLSEAVETAYNALLPTDLFDLPEVRPFRQSIPRDSCYLGWLWCITNKNRSVIWN